jgi:hypothetical protein
MIDCLFFCLIRQFVFNFFWFLSIFFEWVGVWKRNWFLICLSQGAEEVSIHCEIISPICGFLVIVLVNILKKKKVGTKCGLGRDSNPDPSALKPSECTTTPSTFSFMRKRKCSMENRKSVVYLLVTNTMTKKLLSVIFLQWIETSYTPWFESLGEFFLKHWKLLVCSSKSNPKTIIQSDAQLCKGTGSNPVKM